MERRLLKFVWTHGKVDTIKTLILTFMTFPVIYASLEIPKIIVNDALGAGNEPVAFPVDLFGSSLGQVDFLIALCLVFIALIVANNGLKFLLNVQIGLTSERMLRRLRFTLYEAVMRFRIRRFQHMKQGEIVQSVMGEVEPLGGFFGEVISTPVWQGGMLAVYMTFIFLQDPLLGAAAIALYPIQGYIIPKLQRRVVLLNKERVQNVRRIADTVGESVGAIEAIHASDTARWHLSLVADRLYENFRIRLAIFKRKYLIKGLNNFMIALTPFAFYLFGGIQVINGNLEIGSLVAVLAAYKDVAGPWKELLNYFQRWSDLNSRYELVVDNFSGEDVYERERIYGGEEAALVGDLSFRNVSYGPGSSGLNGASCVAPEGSFTAVIGGADGGRDVMMKLMAGLAEPESGRVCVGGDELTELPMPAVGRAIGYASADAAFFSGSLRDNLTYSLRRLPPAPDPKAAEDAAERLAEAELTGNIASRPEADWTDYAAAGVEGAAGLTARLIELAEKVGLADELYHLGLQARMNPDAYPGVAARVMEARERLSEAAAQDPTIADVVEF
ncbi:MAG: ABC transporter ATP-binding protein, partial [Pseudomonadota bacterium]